ncbi:MAG: hypothetical protein E7037_02430 [Verrucomicrobia bacterium]|nr:hypothetical protein [Verrucomicrobiota bacterium]
MNEQKFIDAVRKAAHPQKIIRFSVFTHGARVNVYAEKAPGGRFYCVHFMRNMTAKKIEERAMESIQLFDNELYA